jgi:hypothetical protein
MPGDLEWKKRVVKEFYTLMFNDCRPREAHHPRRRTSSGLAAQLRDPPAQADE